MSIVRRGQWRIVITDVARQNIAEKHRRGGPYNADKSVFRDDLSVEELASMAEHVAPAQQPGTGRWVRTVKVEGERPIGWDRDDQPRWEYTVITEGGSQEEPQALFNAFPGRPNE